MKDLVCWHGGKQKLKRNSTSSGGLRSKFRGKNVQESPFLWQPTHGFSPIRTLTLVAQPQKGHHQIGKAQNYGFQRNDLIS